MTYMAQNNSPMNSADMGVDWSEEIRYTGQSGQTSTEVISGGTGMSAPYYHISYDELRGDDFPQISGREELNLVNPLTQEEMAERIGRVPKYYADIERGDCGMSVETLLALAKTLDLPAPSVRLGVSNLLREVERLNRTLKIPATLKEWGSSPEQIRDLREEMISAALADVTTASNPRPATAECVGAILQKLSGY